MSHVKKEKNFIAYFIYDIQLNSILHSRDVSLILHPGPHTDHFHLK